MTDGDGFAYAENAFSMVWAPLMYMAEELEALRYSGDEVSLPTMALSVAGEWPARHRYGKTWEEIAQEFRYGEHEAVALAGKMRMTREGYVQAESEGARRVLDAVAYARKTDPVKPHFSDDGATSSSLSWSDLGGLALPGGLVARTGVDLAKDEVLRRSSYERKAIDIRAKIRSYDPDWALTRARYEEAALNKWSTATQRNLTYAKTFSWAVAAGGLAWTVMMIPSDEDLDRAIAGWDRIANRCGEIFGNDTGVVREAIADAWAGPAMGAADARLVEFIAAGTHLTERVRRLAEALSDAVEELGRLHKVALVFSTASLAAIVGAGIAARFIPAMRPVTEFLGTRLSSVIVVCAQLAPAAAASALLWDKVAEESRTTRIGDREVTGFRHS